MSKINAQKVKASVAKFCADNGVEVGSHMFNGMFVVSHAAPGGMLEALSRKWYVAKLTAERNDKGQFAHVVRIVTEGEDLHNGAKVTLRRMLAEEGISPSKAKPEVELHGVPVFPCTALAGF